MEPSTFVRNIQIDIVNEYSIEPVGVGREIKRGKGSYRKGVVREGTKRRIVWWHALRIKPLRYQCLI